MTDRNPFVDKTQRHIEALGASSVRLTLMSVHAPDLPLALLETAVRTAAATLDEIGPLSDGSLGLLSLSSAEPDGGARVERRFIPRMQAVLAPLARRRDIGLVHFRAIHRWACEVTDAFDLFDSLYDAPAIVLTLPQAHPSLPFPPRRTLSDSTSPLFPWPSPTASYQPRAQRS
jgi:hypothetical protein